MNLLIISIGFLLTILIIYTLINSYTYLNNNNNNNNYNNDNNNNNNNNDNNDNNDNNKIIKNENKDETNFKKEELLIKYSSIKNKLETEEDYINFYLTFNNSMYVSTIDNHIYNENQIVELISNDITKTKMRYDFNKLKDIYIINIIKNNYNKLIILYDGLIFNENHITFNQNNFSGNTIIYKLNVKNKIINHLLQ
jgi:hypothetical protein